MVIFRAHGQPLSLVTSFHYLGYTLTATGNYCPYDVGNLRKARWTLVQLSQVLGREGVDVRKPGNFYLEVLQGILLFGSDTWVVTPHTRKT